MALVNIKLILTQATMLGLQCELSSLKGQLAMEQAENQLLKIDLARANNLAREGEGLRAKQASRSMDTWKRGKASPICLPMNLILTVESGKRELP